MRVRIRRLIPLLLGGVAAVPLAAQTRAARPAIVVLNLRFDGEHATVLEPGDTAVARAATSRLRATLRASGGLAVVDSSAVADALAAVAADGNPCDSACARAVARRLHADWVAGGTVMKTSNLVWILTAELLDVARGKPVLADSYELKGDATRMGPAGADVFAQRVVKAVTQRQAAVDP